MHMKSGHAAMIEWNRGKLEPKSIVENYVVAAVFSLFLLIAPPLGTTFNEMLLVEMGIIAGYILSQYVIIRILRLKYA